MKIVVLDGFTLNPGDLSWESLKQIGSCEIYDRTPPEKTIERAQGAEIVLTNKTVLSKEIIEQLPKLKYVGVLATGYNVIDIAAAKKNNIIVTNIPAYSTPSVAQMVFSHLLNLTQHVVEHSQKAKTGKWASSIDFSYWDFPLIELKGLTLGIIGTGKIGYAVAKIAQAFEMKVIAYNKRKPINFLEGVNFVTLDEIFQYSDVLSLHCPLNVDTKHIINMKNLSLMKPSAFIINTGRGDLIDESALANSLNNNLIAGAGLDVLSTEPPKTDNPLLTAKNCYITPHIAWATIEARERLMGIAISNIHAFINGNPINTI